MRALAPAPAGQVLFAQRPVIKDGRLGQADAPIQLRFEQSGATAVNQVS